VDSHISVCVALLQTRCVCTGGCEGVTESHVLYCMMSYVVYGSRVGSCVLPRGVLCVFSHPVGVFVCILTPYTSLRVGLFCKSDVCALANVRMLKVLYIL